MMLLLIVISISTFTYGLTNNDVVATENNINEIIPEIDESDMVAAALAEKLDREKSDPSSSFPYFPAFLRFNRINKSGNSQPGGRVPVCFCCRAFQCNHQRCPCPKFIF